MYTRVMQTVEAIMQTNQTSQIKIQGTFEQYSKTRQAIVQRLMYSFGFTYEQAQEELKQLVIGRVLIKEEYYKTVSRVGCSKVLTRKDRMEIWKYCKAIVDENNNEVQYSLQSV